MCLNLPLMSCLLAAIFHFTMRHAYKTDSLAGIKLRTLESINFLALYCSNMDIFTKREAVSFCDNILAVIKVSQFSSNVLPISGNISFLHETCL